MTKELVVIDPEQFGLDTNKVKPIEEAFAPKIAERKGLTIVYEELIKKELTPSLCEEAGELRRKLVKVRTGIANVHKSQKAFFLASGKFVDAWKNKETVPVIQMEEGLLKIEKYFENIEAARIAKIQNERDQEYRKFAPEIIDEKTIATFGEMPEAVWDAFISTAEKNHHDRIEAERQDKIKRDAEELASKLHIQRLKEMTPLLAYLPENYPTDNLGELSEEAFKDLTRKLLAEKTADEARKKRLTEENDELKEKLKSKDVKAKEEDISSDKDKLNKLISSLEGIKNNPVFDFKSKANKKMFEGVKFDIDYIINTIKSK